MNFESRTYACQGVELPSPVVFFFLLCPHFKEAQLYDDLTGNRVLDEMCGFVRARSESDC